MFDVFAGICLFVGLCVCQNDNFRTSKRMMTKLGGRRIIQKSRQSSNLGVIALSRGAQPPTMWRFAESRCATQNVNKATQAGKTSHQMQRPHSTAATTLGKSAEAGLVLLIFLLTALKTIVSIL